MSILPLALPTFETLNVKIHKNWFMTEMLLFMILGENNETDNFKGVCRWDWPMEASDRWRWFRRFFCRTTI
jgi:hypothetical protein